uniref:RNase H type-1 domain-containing protein n=1 Tax=Quercus lobata TaxID=97700 RepID=A0A7N2LA29_QUELO
MRAHIVVRDSSGQVIAALADKIKRPHNVDCLEMMAARRAVRFAHGLAYNSVILRAILKSFSFSHIARQGNTIVQRACLSFPLLVWMENVPSDIDSLVISDFSGLLTIGTDYSHNPAILSCNLS